MDLGHLLANGCDRCLAIVVDRPKPFAHKPLVGALQAVACQARAKHVHEATQHDIGKRHRRQVAQCVHEFAKDKRTMRAQRFGQLRIRKDQRTDLTHTTAMSPPQRVIHFARTIAARQHRGARWRRARHPKHRGNRALGERTMRRQLATDHRMQFAAGDRFGHDKGFAIQLPGRALTARQRPPAGVGELHVAWLGLLLQNMPERFTQVVEVGNRRRSFVSSQFVVDIGRAT